MRKMVFSKKAAIMAAAFVLGMATVTGCGKEEKKTNTETTTSDKQSQKYTVTYYDSDGTTVLKTEKAAADTVLTGYTPEKEGYVFCGWYATPQMNHKFDFDSKISGDTSLFAGFVSYKEDNREFAVVGSGKGPVLLESDWGKVIGDAQKMKKEKQDNANVYTLTLDLCADDEFQFAINTSWNHQRGYGYLNTIQQDGTEYFQNSGSLGDNSSKRSNIKCKVTGNYTFTLTTYPAEDVYETDNANYTEENKEGFNINPFDTITWTYNGEATVNLSDLVTDYYIKGAVVTEWKDVYSDETKFTNENGTYTLKVKLTKGDEFMFTSMVTTDGNSSTGTEYIRYTNITSDDADSLSLVSSTASANLIAEKEGTYVFTYNPSTQVLKVSME